MKIKINLVWRWRILLIAVALVGWSWLEFTHVPNGTESAARAVAGRINFPAPDFTLNTIDGKKIAWSDLRGKVVIVNFWATWCPPCRAEVGDLQAAYQSHQNDFVLLAINNQEENTDVQSFVDQFQVTFPILMDRTGLTATQYNVIALPTSFIIDREGIVRAVNVGGMDRAYIEAQLAKQGAIRP